MRISVSMGQSLFSKTDLNAGSSNGRTGAFEASNLGSIPSPAARHKPVSSRARRRLKD